jgi:hypothetical protein
MFPLTSMATVEIEIETLEFNLLYEWRCSPCIQADPVLTLNALQIVNKIKISTSLNSGNVLYSSIKNLLLTLSLDRAAKIRILFISYTPVKLGLSPTDGYRQRCC